MIYLLSPILSGNNILNANIPKKRHSSTQMGTVILKLLINN